jgi:hypothetical protein
LSRPRSRPDVAPAVVAEEPVAVPA